MVRKVVKWLFEVVYLAVLFATGAVFLTLHETLLGALLILSGVAFIISMVHTAAVYSAGYSITDPPFILAVIIIVGAFVALILGKISVSDLMALITLAINILMGKYMTAYG